MPNSFSFKEAIFQRDLFNYAYYFIFLFLLIYLIIKYYRFFILFLKGKIPSQPSRHISTLFIITAIIFFFSIYIFSNFSADGAVHARQYRYLMPIFPFIFIAMSLSILRPYIISKRIVIIFLNIIILLGLISNIGLASKYNSYGFAKDSLPMPECYELLGFNFGSRNVHDPAKAFEMCGKLEANKKTDCYSGIGIGVADAVGYNPPLIAAKCNQINESYRNTCYIGAGWVFGVNNFFNPSSTSDNACQFFEEKYRPDCYRGVGWAFGWYYGYFPEQVEDKCNNLDDEYKQYCYEWIGYVIGEVKGDISLGVKDCEKFNTSPSLCCKGLLEFKYKTIFQSNEIINYCEEIIKDHKTNDYQ